MKIGYILFNGITWLDFFGVYDPISRLQSLKFINKLQWELCAFTDKVTDNFGLQIIPNRVKESLAEYDVIIVPGGFGTRPLRFDKAFLDWFRTADPVPQKISICTGSLILGAAGFLTQRKATTNFQEYDTLKPYCRQVVSERIVEDQNIITAGAVSSSLDLGLYLCEKWAGKEAAAQVRKRMDYRG
ncbi:MAG: DJ-1/PfpI family protein [Cyclobacteriaceae bacterium]